MRRRPRPSGSPSRRRNTQTEANIQKAEAERQRQIAESQAAEAVRQKAEADAQAWEAKINETLSLAALSRIALADNLPADAVKLALAAWPRIGDEKRSMLRRTIDSFVRAFPDFRERLRLIGHQNWVVTANFSPDGKRIVTASWDKTARVWDAATGAEIMALCRGMTTESLRRCFLPTARASSPLRPTRPRASGTPRRASRSLIAEGT